MFACWLLALPTNMSMFEDITPRFASMVCICTLAAAIFDCRLLIVKLAAEILEFISLMTAKELILPNAKLPAPSVYNINSVPPPVITTLEIPPKLILPVFEDTTLPSITILDTLTLPDASNEYCGDEFTTPTRPLLTSRYNKFDSKAKSVPCRSRLLNSIGPLIRPIAIVNPYAALVLFRLCTTTILLGLTPGAGGGLVKVIVVVPSVV